MDEWKFVVGQMVVHANVEHHLSRKEERVDRVRRLVEARKVVTVDVVVRELDIPDMTVRRILKGLTPVYVREIHGWPTRWRAVTGNR